MDIFKFKERFFSMADFCGIPKPSEQRAQFFYDRCKGIDDSEILNAMAYFSEKGQFPALSLFLAECGIRPKSSRAEREKARRAFEEADKSGYELPDAREIYGEFTIESVAESEDETAAKKELDAKTEGLKSIGWNVSSFIDYKCRKDVVDGRYNRERILWKRHHRAFRFRDPNPDHDPRFTQLLRLMEAAVHAAAAQ